MTLKFHCYWLHLTVPLFLKLAMFFFEISHLSRRHFRNVTFLFEKFEKYVAIFWIPKLVLAKKSQSLPRQDLAKIRKYSLKFFKNVNARWSHDLLPKENSLLFQNINTKLYRLMQKSWKSMHVNCHGCHVISSEDFFYLEIKMHISHETLLRVHALISGPSLAWRFSNVHQFSGRL